MCEVNKKKNHEAAFLAAAILSVAAHCVAAALLTQFVRREPVVPASQVMTVEIKASLPAVESVAAAVSRPARRVEEPMEPRQVSTERREPLTIPRPVDSADQPVLATVPPANRGTVRATPAPESTLPCEPAGAERPAHASGYPKSGGPPAVAVQAESATAAAAYLARLRTLIERQKAYPVAARRGHLQGTVRIRCVLARNGEVITVALHDSSGHEILDNAALRAVREAGRFPGLPVAITGATFAFIVPVVFRIEGG
jgi:protein TonB